VAETIYAKLPAGTYYAKPLPLVQAPWGDDVVALNVVAGNVFASASIGSPAKYYAIYEQAGGSPADTDNAVSGVEMIETIIATV
jgi:hypothetical protein